MFYCVYGQMSEIKNYYYYYYYYGDNIPPCLTTLVARNFVE